MAMVILSCALRLLFGACIGFICAGLCAAASDKTQRRLNSDATPMGRALSGGTTSASGLYFEDGKSREMQQGKERCPLCNRQQADESFRPQRCPRDLRQWPLQCRERWRDGASYFHDSATQPQ